MTHDGLTGSIPPWAKERRLVATESADPVAKSTWLRFRCVNHVFAFTLTGGIQTDSQLNTISVICSIGTFLRIAAYALEQGYDGPALRYRAGMLNPVESDMRTEEMDRAFREMSVDAPVSNENARLFLAIESRQKALHGQSN